MLLQSRSHLLSHGTLKEKEIHVSHLSVPLLHNAVERLFKDDY